jgi:hypothetical protein
MASRSLATARPVQAPKPATAVKAVYNLGAITQGMFYCDTTKRRGDNQDCSLLYYSRHHFFGRPRSRHLANPPSARS